MRGLSLADPATIGDLPLPAPFNIRWNHAVWAGDPQWANPGDGNPVSSWRNQFGVGDPAAAGSVRPTFRASVAAFNSKPAVEFVAANSQVLDFDIANIAQPLSVVVVAKLNATGTARRCFGNGNGSSSGLGVSATQWTMHFGTALSGGASDTNTHMLRGYANGASSDLLVDGTSVAAGTANTNNINRFSIGAATNGATPSSFWDGHIAFVGIIAGDVSALAEWAAFKAWVASEYGLTIA